MGDIEVGHSVITPNGSSSKVLQTHPQGVKPLYEFSFIDGSKTLATLDHLWKYKVVGKPNCWKIGSTKKLIELLNKAKKSSSIVTPNILIPTCEEIEYSQKKLPIKPYTFGVLIAEGCFRGNSTVFSSVDIGVVEKIEEEGYPVSIRKREDSHCINDNLETRKKLEVLNLWNKKSKDKFIPSIYLNSSIKQRLDLVKGLMDGDGYIDKRGHCEYTTTSKQLAKDVRVLIKSLGGKATIKKHKSSYVSKSGKRIWCLDKFRIYIRVRDNKVLFNLERKRERSLPFNGGIGKSHLRLISIKYWGLGEAKCITIEDREGLYLTDDFIVTHNSYLVRAREILRRLQFPKTHGAIIRKTFPELRANHIIKLWEEYPMLKQYYNKQDKTIYYPNGSTTVFNHLQHTDDVYNYQGVALDDISIDEVTQHEEEVFKILRSSNRRSNTDPYCKITPTMFLTGNPLGVGHQFIKRLFVDKEYKPREKPTDYLYIKASIYDNPKLLDVDPAYIDRLQALPEQQRRAYLEGDWNIAAGLAFSELSKKVHIVDPIKLDDSVKFFGGYDYGYNHPFAFILFAITQEKQVYVVDYVKARNKRPDEQAKMILEKLRDIKRVQISAGTDIWADRQGKGTIKKEMQQIFGSRAVLVRAYTNRVDGVSEIRKHLAYIGTKSGEPKLKFFRGTEAVFGNIQEMQFDEKKPEDVIKLNANEEGEGGDDLFDAFRYGVMQTVHPIEKNDTIKVNTGQYLLDLVKQESSYKKSIRQWQ